MTTVSTIRDRIISRLNGSETRRIDVLGATCATADTTIHATLLPASLKQDAIVQVGTEQLRVTAVSGTTVTVLRGWNGTTAIQHATASIVDVNPRWSAQLINELMKEELASWPIELGPIHAQELTLAKDARTVSLADDSYTGDVLRLMTVKAITNPTKDYRERLRIPAVLAFDPDASLEPQGVAIQFPQTYNEALTIEVEYLTSYDLSLLDTDSTDLETTLLMDEHMLDILIYGTAARAMMSREASRSSSADQTAVANEQVPPTYLQQTGQFLRQMRDQRISDEIYRLYGLYPMLQSTTEV